MRGAVFTQHGGIENLTILDDLPIPEPQHGQVRVKIKAVALNRLDLWVREGWKGLNLTMPHIVCADGAGIVDALGEGVTQFQIGDAVAINPTLLPDNSPALLSGLENQAPDSHILGEGVTGVASEYAVLPARNLHKMPEGYPFESAAGAGLVYVTAWHSLMIRGGLRAGETVLIIGAGGGVNSASIQIAKLAGATVYVVGSDAEKCAQAKALGADVTINRADDPNWAKAIYKLTNKQGVDVVIDNVGQATLSDSVRSTRVGGRILIVGNTSGYDANIDIRQIFARQISIIGSTMGPHQDYVKVMDLVFAGKLEPVIGAVLPLADIQKAHQMLENFEVFGKIVLTVD